MSKYGELLKDPRWQRKRLEIMQRDDFHCRACNTSDSTLNVHHSHYRNGAEGPWDYPETALITLCERCHGSVHRHGGWSRVVVEAVTDIAFPKTKPRRRPCAEMLARVVYYPWTYTHLKCLPNLWDVRHRIKDGSASDGLFLALNTIFDFGSGPQDSQELVNRMLETGDFWVHLLPPPSAVPEENVLNEVFDLAIELIEIAKREAA